MGTPMVRVSELFSPAAKADDVAKRNTTANAIRDVRIFFNVFSLSSSAEPPHNHPISSHKILASIIYASTSKNPINFSIIIVPIF